MTSIAHPRSCVSLGSVPIPCIVLFVLLTVTSPTQAQLEVDSLEVWGLMRQAAERVSGSVVQNETLGGLETVDGN